MSRGGGRRPKLTDEIQAIIVDTIRKGATFEAAAGAAGVSVDTIHEWRRRGAGKDDRPRTARLAEFARAIERAMAEAEIRCVGAIGKASSRQWQAAAWLLERRHPDRYGLRTQSRVDLDARVGLDARVELERALDRITVAVGGAVVSSTEPGDGG